MTDPPPVDPVDFRLRSAMSELGQHEIAAASPPDPDALARELDARVQSVPPRGPWFTGALPITVIALALGAGIGLGATGRVNVSSDAPARIASVAPVSTYRCPGTEPVGSLHRGDRIVSTGRSADAAWLEIRSPANLEQRVWVDARVITPDTNDATEKLREVAPSPTCAAAPVLGAVAPTSTEATSTTADTEFASGATTTTTLPTSSTTAPTSTTSASSPTIPAPTTPTSTGPGPGPTVTQPAPTSTTPPPADTQGPTVTNVARNNADIYEQAVALCTGLKKTSVVAAKVTDASGIASVTLLWSVNGQSGQVTMTAQGGFYTGTLGTFAYHTVPANQQRNVDWSIRATDTKGNVTTVTPTDSTVVVLHSADQCFG